MFELATVLITFFVLLAAVALFGVYVYWKKHTHTREYFAFAVLNASLFLSLFVLMAVLTQQTPWAAVMGVVKTFLGLPPSEISPLNTEQLILTLIVWAGLLWLLWNIYKHWDGQKSQAQYQREQAGASDNPFVESILLFKHVSRLQRIELYQESDADKHTMLEGAVADLAWREQARDLVELSRKDYRFEPDAWHDEAACWIGTHQGTGERIVLAAWQHQAEANNRFADLTAYIERVKQGQDWQQSVLYVIAIQDGSVNEPKWHNGTAWLVSESALLDGLIHFGDYFRHISQQVEQNTLQDTELCLQDIYTVSRYRLEKKGEAQPNIENFIDDWLKESSLRQMALLGDYGQGKSTLSLMYSYQLMQHILAGDTRVRIPILLTLRGKSPRNLQPDELLSTWAGRFGIDTRALMKLLMAGRLLLIFEGFDEVDLAGDSEARLRHFQVLWSLCYRHAKILITGRPNFFLDDEELKRALGIQERSLERPYCQAVWLAAFDSTQMAQALRSETQQTREEILALAQHNVKFHEVVARPSMLRIVSFLWQREKLSEQQHRINSALVMDEFVRHTLERQAAKDQPSQYMQLNPAEREYFMAGVAVYMLVNKLPNQITHQQLDQLAAQLVNSIPDCVSQQGHVLAGKSRQPLRLRLQDAKEGYDKALDGIKNDVRTCGLLESDTSRNGSFKFGHKSFMEFLAGKVFAQFWVKDELLEVERLSAESLVHQLKLKHAAIVEQEESLIFSAEWLSQFKNNKTDKEKTLILFKFIFSENDFLYKMRNFMIKVSTSILNKIALNFNEEILKIPHTTDAVLFIIISLLASSFFAGALIGLPIFIISSMIVFLITVFTTFPLAAIVTGVISPKFEYVFFIVGGIASIFYFTYLFPDSSAFEETSVIKALSDVFPLWFAIAFQYLIIFIYFIVSFLLGLMAGLNEGRLKRKPEYLWIYFEHWHTACINAKLSREAMQAVVGKGGLRLIEKAKQSDAHAE